MNLWFQEAGQFLFGTPKRSLITLVVIGLIVLGIKPSLGMTFAENLMIGLMPFVQPVLWLVIVAIGIRVMFKGWNGGGSKKKK